MEDEELALFRAFLRATKEERQEFWKALEEHMIANGMTPGFYHPYIPLQMTKVTKPEK